MSQPPTTPDPLPLAVFARLKTKIPDWHLFDGQPWKLVSTDAGDYWSMHSADGRRFRLYASGETELRDKKGRAVWKRAHR